MLSSTTRIDRSRDRYDICGRRIGLRGVSHRQKLSENLNQNFVIDDCARASGIIAMETGVKAPHVGYTIIFATIGTVASIVAVHEKLPYHPIRDYAPISMAADTYFMCDFLAPANTPQPIVIKLNGEIRKALAAVEVRERRKATGAIPA